MYRMMVACWWTCCYQAVLRIWHEDDNDDGDGVDDVDDDDDDDDDHSVVGEL